ncbi:hypothetical protein S245_042409, partial [Arachis hypogaea]
WDAIFIVDLRTPYFSKPNTHTPPFLSNINVGLMISTNLTTDSHTILTNFSSTA